MDKNRLKSTRLRDALLGVDLWFALIFFCAGVICHLCNQWPSRVEGDIVEKLASIGVSVFSIVFGLFITGLTVMVTTGSDDFIAFFNVNGSYIRILRNLKLSATMLFLALISSLILNIIAAISKTYFNIYFLIAYGSISICALVTTMLVLYDGIEYAIRRADFVDSA
ncbi:MAG: hypothetical protein BGO01_02625 [Armatimonadetes bacterium 55-13]|mgnify:CR=1 FL=1|nr:MAG: hypothetical protein ABT09_00485 [bacterium SCN 57-13]OJU62148.1 MAG: hypothetical protein BGO01_02625 [Armatimonadetes bacterium 55-13]